MRISVALRDSTASRIRVITLEYLLNNGTGATINIDETAPEFSSSKGLYLLFAQGKLTDINTFVQISKEYQVDNVIESDKNYCSTIDNVRNIDHLNNDVLSSVLWVGLLIDGMTFDVMGFPSGVGAELPEFIHKFDIAKSREFEGMEGLKITPGPHLTGAENTMPIVMAMVRLAVSLSARLDQLIGVGWGPSCSVMGPEYFSKVAASWLEGGAFPALGLTAFRQVESGGFVSEGLGFFTGQELALGPELAGNPNRATRLGIRLVNELVGAAPVTRVMEFSGPDGERLQLSPSDDGRLVRVIAG